METNVTTYEKVLKEVADVVVASNKVEVSLNNCSDSFIASVFVNDGDKKTCIFTSFFYESDNNQILEAKYAGFEAIVNYLKNH